MVKHKYKSAQQLYERCEEILDDLEALKLNIKYAGEEDVEKIKAKQLSLQKNMTLTFHTIMEAKKAINKEGS